jgi:hypothetical protein
VPKPASCPVRQQPPAKLFDAASTLPARVDVAATISPCLFSAIPSTTKSEKQRTAVLQKRKEEIAQGQNRKLIMKKSGKEKTQPPWLNRSAPQKQSCCQRRRQSKKARPPLPHQSLRHRVVPSNLHHHHDAAGEPMLSIPHHLAAAPCRRCKINRRRLREEEDQNWS